MRKDVSPQKTQAFFSTRLPLDPGGRRSEYLGSASDPNFWRNVRDRCLDCLIAEASRLVAFSPLKNALLWPVTGQGTKDAHTRSMAMAMSRHKKRHLPRPARIFSLVPGWGRQHREPLSGTRNRGTRWDEMRNDSRHPWWPRLCSIVSVRPRRPAENRPEAPDISPAGVSKGSRGPCHSLNASYLREGAKAQRPRRPSFF